MVCIGKGENGWRDGRLLYRCRVGKGYVVQRWLEIYNPVTDDGGGV